jgi:hypothetical protein
MVPLDTLWNFGLVLWVEENTLKDFLQNANYETSNFKHLKVTKVVHPYYPVIHNTLPPLPPRRRNGLGWGIIILPTRNSLSLTTLDS